MTNTREITYYDVSPYAAMSANAQTEQNKTQDFSALSKLFAENMIYRNIQTCEHNYTILDGTHREFDLDENIALWSKTQSLEPVSSRLFPESITLEITFGGLQSSPGITFYFDTQNNNWCDMLTIKYYKNGSLISDMTFEPDSPVYACRNQVDLYNKVTIEFIRMNMPHRYLKLEAVLFGIVRIFGDGDLESLTLNEGFDPTGRTVYINSANFIINTKDPAPYIFLKRQPLRVRYNGLYMGTYYIDKSKRYADRRHSVEAVDKIGVLDSSAVFLGGVYNNISANNLINQIVGGVFDVEIENSLKNIAVSGWLPVMSRRDALAQVAVAIGAKIDASRTDYISIEPIPELGDINNISRVIDKSRVYRSGSVDIEFPCTGIELTEHNFTVGSEIKELYKDNFTGEKTVTFSEPAANLTIQNGVILSGGANYAVIESYGGGECVLSGRLYIDSQSAVTVKCGDILEGAQERTEKITDCYLVNKNNSNAVAQRLFDYYLRQNVFDGDFLADTGENAEKIGDIVKIATAAGTNFDGNIAGQIERLTLYLGSKNIKARGIIRGN